MWALEIQIEDFSGFLCYVVWIILCYLECSHISLDLKVIIVLLKIQDQRG